MRFAAPLSLVAFALCSSAAFADDETPPVVGGKTYAQHQILAAKARYPEILSITVIGKRPDDKQPVVLGSVWLTPTGGCQSDSGFLKITAVCTR